MGIFGGLIPTSLGVLASFSILIANVLLYHHLKDGLPTPLTTVDIVSGEDLFITSRAKSDLIGLAQIGEKVVGSYANQVLAVEYLNELLLEIQAGAINNKTVQVDVQTASGAYYLSEKLQGLTNVYFNMVNVIARLSDGNSSGDALLVNCHFDSAPSSNAASDNGLNCASMIEVLRVLSQSRSTLANDVIFLFNGAEENPLEASHAFIKYHAWAVDVRAFLNYDAAGHGGREELFQTGPNNPWLVKHYGSAVPHPHGTVVVTDIFSTGIVPSDTDFRIFRDYGGIPGLDMAHYLGGYVYHTIYDNYDIIPDGTYQHTGDNMLALVKALANADELADTDSYADGDVVFFDFLGLYFVRYSTRIAIIINVAAAVVALYAPLRFIVGGCYPKKTFSRFLIRAAVQLTGIVLGLGLAVLFGMICDWTGHAMSWFNKPWILIGLFVLPALLPLLVVNWVLSVKSKGSVDNSNSRPKPGQNLQLNSEAVNLLWAIVLIGLTIYGLKSAFLIAMVVGFVGVANVISSVLRLQRNVKLWAFVYVVIGLLIPTLYILWIGSIATSILPIMGRSGSQIIPDLYVSVIFGALTVMMGSLWAPLIGTIQQPRTLIAGFSIAAVITLLAVLLTPFGFPYSADPVNPMPQRFWLIHVERTTYDIEGNVTYNDAGYWIQNMDRNSPTTIQIAVSELRNATVVKDTCLDTIYCGMPLFKSRDMTMLNKSIWVPADAPTAPEANPSTLSATWNDMSNDSRRLYLNISGPDHMTFFFAPRIGANLTGWSLLEDIPTANTWNGRSLYYVWYSYGMTAELPWQIWLDLTVPTDGSPAIDIAVNAHYLHNSTTTSAPYQTVLDQLPVWVAPLHWTSTYKSYIF